LHCLLDREIRPYGGEKTREVFLGGARLVGKKSLNSA